MAGRAEETDWCVSSRCTCSQLSIADLISRTVYVDSFVIPEFIESPILHSICLTLPATISCFCHKPSRSDHDQTILCKNSFKQLILCSFSKKKKKKYEHHQSERESVSGAQLFLLGEQEPSGCRFSHKALPYSALTLKKYR